MSVCIHAQQVRGWVDFVGRGVVAGRSGEGAACVHIERGYLRVALLFSPSIKSRGIPSRTKVLKQHIVWNKHTLVFYYASLGVAKEVHSEPSAHMLGRYARAR